MTGVVGSHEGSAARPTPARLGPYEVIRPLARGGMADVYLARAAGPDAPHLAIKVLDPVRASEREILALFLHEARVCALLDHHNLAAVVEVAAAEGRHYLAMEYVHGVDLRGLLGAAHRSGRALPYETAIAIACAAAAGLDHAHRRCDRDGRPLRLVHRDVSLSNIMVGYDGGVKVVDFGIATTTISNVHTNPGVVRGKASYMSPEQCLGDDVDLRTDVFALGVVLYELTTGARCFHGKSDFDRMLAVVRGEFTAPSVLVPDYPPELEHVVRTALSVDASRRFASCAAMIDALEQISLGRGWFGGPPAIARLMRELFGAAPDPDAAAEVVVSADQIVCAIDAAADQPTARQPVLAATAGAEADTAIELPAARALPPWIDDDEPTNGRGRRRRPSTARIAA